MDPITQQTALACAGAAGDAAEALYVDDVYSTFVYEGTGGSNTITNDIDLSGEGGMVWVKARDAANAPIINDTERGAGETLRPDSSGAEFTNSGMVSSFNSDGFTLGTAANVNSSGTKYVGWSFRKAPGFFDVVTFSLSSGTTNERISHSLGSTPGFIITKKTNTNSSWACYHRSLGRSKHISLQSNAAATSFTNAWGTSDPTDTDFGMAGGVFGAGTYVAYVFAHDDQSFGDDSDEAIIKCGSYTGTGTSGLEVNLGFEPQFLMMKRAEGSGDWYMFDDMRGWGVNDRNYLEANTSDAEAGPGYIVPTSTGFKVIATGTSWNENNKDYIYVAIRRPHKPPEAGTDVFKATKASGTTDMTTNFPVDLLINKSNYSSGTNNYVVDRLRGSRSTMVSDGSNTEYTGWTQDAFPLDNNIGVDAPGWASSGDTWSTHLFRRAPGFLDIVAYTGNSSARDINHNLGVTPQLIILKSRTLGESWPVLSTLFSDVTANRLTLNLNGALSSGTSGFFKTPTATTFGIGSAAPSEGQWNRSGEDYIAYLFATLDGISKVGTYSGTGSDVDVDCGFSAGARYVLIKRTDSTGNWYVFDHAQGIVSGNDGYWNYDTNGAGVTSNDYIDPLNSGFTVSSSAPAALNASGGTYLFLAIA